MKDDHVYAKYVYILGDNDSKSEGRRLCYLEAKRLCIEKAGVYIESNTIIRNYQLTLDEIKSYAGAIIQFEVIHEEIKMIGKSLAIEMIVKAKIDINSLRLSETQDIALSNTFFQSGSRSLFV